VRCAARSASRTRRSSCSPHLVSETLWEKLSHSFQLSSTVQAYSALPLNITSGVTTIQGTAGRPIVDGEFIAAIPVSATTSSA